MTTVISLIGGPGILKSTVAAELYAKMKRKHLKVEMVREVAKEWAWDGRQIGPFEQISILGEQIKKESSLYNKVDYIVTDSPVLLGSFYFEYNHNQYFMSNMVESYYTFGQVNGIKFKNYLLPRYPGYQQDGRFEDEARAKLIDSAIKNYMVHYFYEYEKVSEYLEPSQVSDWILSRTLEKYND